MKRSSAVSTGHGDELAQGGHEELGLGRLLAVLAAERQRQPDDDLLGLELGDEACDLGKAVLGCRLANDADGTGQRSARVGDGDAGTGGAVVEREDSHLRSAARIMRSASAERARGRPIGVLAAGASHRAAAAATAADERRCALDDVRRADLVGDRVVEVRDQRHLAVVDAAEHDGRRSMALLEAVGEVEQRIAVEALDGLDDQVEAVLGPDDRLDLSPASAVRRLALELLARLLELEPNGVELA